MLKKAIKKANAILFPEQLGLLRELHYASVFKDAIVNCDWLVDKTFISSGWSAGYPFLYVLYRTLNNVCPKTILEFGLGETTRISFQYNKAFTGSELTVIDENKDWIDYYAKEIKGVEKNVIHLSVKQKNVSGYKVCEYENLGTIVSKKKYQLVIVDGPTGSKRFSRHQIVDLVDQDCLADDFIIFMDDINRKGEKDTVKDLFKKFKQKGIAFSHINYSGIKGTKLICAPRYNFLLSL